MRTLYLPTDGRRSPLSEVMLGESLPDTVRSDPHSKIHAAWNAALTELERTTALFAQMDPRPWLADTRAPGILRPVEEGEKLREVSFDKLLYAAPERWELAHIGSYPYSVATVYDEAGSPITAGDVDRAVIAGGELLFQKGTHIYRLSGEQAYEIDPVDDGVLGASRPRVCLVSLGAEEYGLYGGRPYEEREVTSLIEGFHLTFGGGGRFEATLSYTGIATIEDGADLSALPNFVKGGTLYDTSGEARSYTTAANVITVADAESGENFQLYYQAAHVFSFNSPAPAIREPAYELLETYRVSFRHLTEHMATLPTDHDITCVERLDTVCRVPSQMGPIRIDAAGYVGGIGVGHPVFSVLPSEFHTVVASRESVSLVEPGAQLRLITQRFPGLSITGLTWTPDLELGLIASSSAGFDLYALRDLRPLQTQGWTAA